MSMDDDDDEAIAMPVASVPWDAGFEHVVRAALPGLAASAPLSPRRPYAAMGLDSLGTVALVARLVEHFRLTVPMDRLHLRDFRNAGQTWDTLSRLCQLKSQDL